MKIVYSKIDIDFNDREVAEIGNPDELFNPLKKVKIEMSCDMEAISVISDFIKKIFDNQ